MKKNIYAFIILISIIGIFFIVKIISYNKYSKVSDIDIRKSNNISIKHVEQKDYLSHNGIKIRNDFKKFVYEASDDTYILFDEEEDIIKMFSMAQIDTLIDIFLNSSVLSKDYLEKFLNDNKVTNDKELIELLYNYDLSINIFTSINEMKLKNYIYFFMSDVFPLVYEYYFINGDYEGYIVRNYNHEEETSIDVYLYNNGNRYVFSFLGIEVDENKIYELIGTVVFE